MITSYISLRLYLTARGRSSHLGKSIKIRFSHIKKTIIIRISRSFTQCSILFIDSPAAGSIFRTNVLLSFVSWYNVLFYNIGSDLYMQSKCIWIRSELLGGKKFFCHAQGPLRGPGSEDAPRGHKGVRLTPQVV